MKWLPHKVIIFTKFQKDWTKFVDFLSMANFWRCLFFFTQTLFVYKDLSLHLIIGFNLLTDRRAQKAKRVLKLLKHLKFRMKMLWTYELRLLWSPCSINEWNKHIKPIKLRKSASLMKFEDIKNEMITNFLQF